MWLRHGVRVASKYAHAVTRIPRIAIVDRGDWINKLLRCPDEMMECAIVMLEPAQPLLYN